MNRLQLELDRLFAPATTAANGDPIGASRAVRTLVLELALPADWERLSAVWRGVQLDLELPAPAIAVSGVDGLQLWFSLAVPASQDDGAAFLEGLRTRYLPDVAPKRVRLAATPADLPTLPPFETAPDRWSAFVAPDLAAVFAETPWLDVAPNDDGQATLLRALEPMPRDAFDAARRQLAAAAQGLPATPTSPMPADAPAPQQPEPTQTDPARFLVGVMNDETAPLALRVEAAKALLAAANRA